VIPVGTRVPISSGARAQVSAIISAAGASAQAKYARGVAVFTLAKAGLMAEVSIGGQKFGYEAFAPRVKARTGR